MPSKFVLTGQPWTILNQPAPPPRVTDGRIHLVDSGKLLPGDILLCSDPEGSVSRVICAVTKSPYSHAAICVGDGQFIEAIGSGVRRFLVDRTAVRDPQNVRFLRLKDVADARKAAATAGKKAENYLARRYWVNGAITAIFTSAGRQHGGRFFCSHLVAQAYQESNVELLDGVKPHNVIPGHLINSPKLRDITDDVLLPPDAPHRWRPNDLLDGPTRKTLHDEEISVQQKVDERVAALFHEHGLDAPKDLFGALKALWELDEPDPRRQLDLQFAQILKEEGYDALPQLGQGKLVLFYEQPGIIRRMIAGGADVEELLELRNYAQLMQHRLRQRILDDEYGLIGFEAHHERTGYATFGIMAEIRRETLVILKDADACLGESIQLLNEDLCK